MIKTIGLNRSPKGVKESFVFVQAPTRTSRMSLSDFFKRVFFNDPWRDALSKDVNFDRFYSNEEVP